MAKIFLFIERLFPRKPGFLSKIFEANNPFETILLNCIHKEKGNESKNQQNITYTAPEKKMFLNKLVIYLKGNFIDDFMNCFFAIILFAPFVLYAIELYNLSELNFIQTTKDILNSITNTIYKFIITNLENCINYLKIIFSHKMMKIIFLYKLFLFCFYFTINII